MLFYSRIGDAFRLGDGVPMFVAARYDACIGSGTVSTIAKFAQIRPTLEINAYVCRHGRHQKTVLRRRSSRARPAGQGESDSSRGPGETEFTMMPAGARSPGRSDRAVHEDQVSKGCLFRFTGQESATMLCRPPRNWPAPATAAMLRARPNSGVANADNDDLAQ